MKTETPSVKIVAITADEAGQRIDNFLRTQLKGVPKSMIYRIVMRLMQTIHIVPIVHPAERFQ